MSCQDPSLSCKDPSNPCLQRLRLCELQGPSWELPGPFSKLPGPSCGHVACSSFSRASASRWMKQPAHIRCPLVHCHGMEWGWELQEPSCELPGPFQPIPKETTHP